MMLGWLFFGYKNSPKMLSFLTVSVGILFVFLVANNVYRMEEFIWFLDKNYR
jgi:CRISPR/Cas system CMR subunit Cmr6 (Cas7 group RAMP superfamily)